MMSRFNIEFQSMHTNRRSDWESLRRSLSVSLLFVGDQIKEDEMGGTCSTHGRGEKCLNYFGWKT